MIINFNKTIHKMLQHIDALDMVLAY